MEECWRKENKRKIRREREIERKENVGVVHAHSKCIDIDLQEDRKCHTESETSRTSP